MPIDGCRRHRCCCCCFFSLSSYAHSMEHRKPLLTIYESHKYTLDGWRNRDWHWHIGVECWRRSANISMAMPLPFAKGNQCLDSITIFRLRFYEMENRFSVSFFYSFFPFLCFALISFLHFFSLLLFRLSHSWRVQEKGNLMVFSPFTRFLVCEWNELAMHKHHMNARVCLQSGREVSERQQ